MNDKLNAPWLFVIDTEDYSGNFERELCAYITGRVGECGVGEEMAKLFNKEVTDMGEEPFSDVIDEEDGGCWRPATSYPTPGWFNDGMGGAYQEGGEKEALMRYRKNAAEYYRNICYNKYWKSWQENPLDRERYTKAGWTEQKLKKAAEDEEKKAQEAEKTTVLSKYPSYQSVAISFDKKPTTKEIDTMKSRAYTFSEMKNEYDKKRNLISKITGFRLIKNNVKRTTEEENV